MPTLRKLVKTNFFRILEINQRLVGIQWAYNQEKCWLLVRIGSFVANLTYPTPSPTPQLSNSLKTKEQIPLKTSIAATGGERIGLEPLQRPIPIELSLFLSDGSLEDSIHKAVFYVTWLRAYQCKPFSWMCLSKIVRSNCLTPWLPEVVNDSWDKQQVNQKA